MRGPGSTTEDVSGPSLRSDGYGTHLMAPAEPFGQCLTSGTQKRVTFFRSRKPGMHVVEPLFENRQARIAVIGQGLGGGTRLRYAWLVVGRERVPVDQGVP